MLQLPLRAHAAAAGPGNPGDGRADHQAPGDICLQPCLRRSLVACTPRWAPCCFTWPSSGCRVQLPAAPSSSAAPPPPSSALGTAQLAGCSAGVHSYDRHLPGPAGSGVQPTLPTARHDVQPHARSPAGAHQPGARRLRPPCWPPASPCWPLMAWARRRSTCSSTWWSWRAWCRTKPPPDSKPKVCWLWRCRRPGPGSG